MSSEEGHITVVEVKRYAYCPRIVFITHVLHYEEVVTEAMEMGREEHDERTIAPLVSKLKAKNVIKGLELCSNSLKLIGKLDYLIITKHGEHIPIEVKWAESDEGKVKWDHKLQLAAYALIVEENFKTTVKRGYVYYLREHKLAEVLILDGLKGLVKKIINEIHEMLRDERDPGVRVPLSKCINCGYKQYCRPGLEVLSVTLYKEGRPRRGPAS